MKANILKGLLILIALFSITNLKGQETLEEIKIKNSKLESEIKRITEEFDKFKMASNESINGKEAELASCNSNLTDLKEYYLKLQQENQSTQELNFELLKKIKDIVPRRITVKDYRITHNRAYFHLNTDRPCKMKLTLKNGELTADKRIIEFGRNDIFYESPPLAQETKYQLSIDVYDLQDNIIPALRKEKSTNPELSFKTSSLPKGIQLKTFVVNPYSNRINIELEANQKCIFRISCYERISEEKFSSKPVFTLSDSLKKDKFDRYVVPLKSGKRRFSFTSLKHDKEYKIIVELFGEFGTTKSEKMKRTDKYPLGFDGPISMNFNRIESEITWKAKGNPKLGRLILINPNDTSDHYSFKADQDGNFFKVSLDYNSITKIWSNEMSSTKSNAVVPIIKVLIIDENGYSRTQSSRVSFSLPDKEKLKKAKKDELISEDEEKQILKVIEAIDGKKKFKWEDLITAGIPLILSFL
ncbi:MAG: hypothetical protein AAF655_21925 [Bacteroidota bacterium]